jgi:tetratricopeptide (TPR) repeat protein
MSDSPVTEVWRIELARGLRRLAQGDTDGATACFARAHRGAPDRPEVCFALGRQRLRAGDLAEAEPLLARAWSSGLVVAAAALARCRARAGQRDEARAVLEAALAVAGDAPGLHVVRAELLLEDGRHEDARVALDRAAQVTTASAPATRAAITAAQARCHHEEGLALAARGEREAALFAFKRAFDLDPAWASPLVNMGAVLAELGRPARARACYERALVLDPENSVARFDLALLARARGDVATAEREPRLAIATDPGNEAARLVLAELLCARQDAPGAFALFAGDAGAPDEGELRAAAAAEPIDVGACIRLARLLGQRGELGEAVALLQRARQGLRPP